MQSILTFLLILSGLLFTSESQTNQPETDWPADLNTGEKAVYLDQYEKQIVLELNKVRHNPARYAIEYLEPLRSAYNGDVISLPGSAPLKTREGIAALDECIRALKSASPVAPLIPVRGLSSAAELLVKDQKTYGGTGHLTKSGWTPQVRMKRFGAYQSKLAENLVYGYDKPRNAIISLLIDDGVADRGHRNNILDAGFTEIGVAADEHPTYKYFCTIEFTDGFTPSTR